MPDFPRHPAEHDSETAQTDPAARYTIRRKGSRYNITGPNGREYSAYKSASVVGPRWEELTHTPWPYESSAYISGTRLWQLDLIDRKDVGKTTLAGQTTSPDARKRAKPRLEDAPAPPPRTPSASEEVAKAAESPTAKPRTQLKPAKQPPKQLSLLGDDVPGTKAAPSKPKAKPRTARKKAAPKPNPAKSAPPKPPKQDSAPQNPSQPVAPQATPQPRSTIVISSLTIRLLPAPRIDLEKHTRTIQALRRNPQMLFNADVRQALEYEVEYNRPFARWAQTLLTMLLRYERRQQRIRPAIDSKTILAKHIAWQEENQRNTPATTAH